jgi:hypothetical protein
MVKWLYAAVMERVRQSMAGEVNDKRAALTSERWEDWRPIEATGKTTVYQQERGASAKFQRLSLAP